MAALLNYGEPQILELFKNTLLSRIYDMLYQINDLRVVVETAKRLLTKEQMDKKSDKLLPAHSCKLVRTIPKVRVRMKRMRRKCPLVL